MGSLFITELSNVFGVSYSAMVFILVLVFIWSAVWKLMALWKSARKSSLAWFIVLGVVNTLGILEILYIYVFSEMKGKKSVRPAKKKRR